MNRNIRITLVVCLFGATAFLVLWAAFLYNSNGSRCACYNKCTQGSKSVFAENDWLFHIESEKFSILNASTCGFGKSSAKAFFCYVAIVIVSYPLLISSLNKAKGEIVNYIFFAITLMVVGAAACLSFMLNLPLFIRLIPALITITAASVVFIIK